MANEQESAPRFVGKAELCEIIGWSRPTLDLRLSKDAGFPVRRRGGRGAKWEFDVSAVQSYLAGVKLLPRAADPVKPGRPPKPRTDDAAEEGEKLTQAELTQRQRRDAAQAALLEDKLRVARGELVDAEEVRLTLTTVLTQLGKGLEGLGDTIVSRLRLPAEHGVVIRELIDELRQTSVRDLRRLLNAPIDG
ncbi:terminase small subunit [Paraburkholderia caballeronis]|uniref:Phage DNA packaging protein, Nu1 subunit of terminase n=1 Tax=Paraburkholderia caballeronis TaxID=416943 RepID=A0A1H7TZC3_9BURK|nr:terminase small subunit [Paraburkholderia caballeronis]PXW23397.1 phage terminase Nu1 subunit (DNA packaging protein) [Paraburkholderia caballeronis]PXW98390.1 phage terminase Nu1 subunit (DNA packaging protein) [Paraburkholderia caballeronis]RAJ95121.1 phage terminase Nu1 subunit (DNA packaging protein) [Paraburkholderia caballeronis]SEC55942.1 Phage DNA packaging protein, Nu1 subunit of terminase [Paraburkholderia caballeronis]SEL89766.1 Phage DNA packaging protein, Nu1 subunit of termina